MTKTEKQKIIRKNIPILLAFLAPIVILICLYIIRGIFPFGDEMYLRSDMYHQYAPFMKLFQSLIKSGGSLEYTWNIGLGSNFMSTYAYYLASPLNWIIGLFPSTIVPEIMSSFIILKAGLMSATFTYYLTRKFGKKNLCSTCFGIFYAMSGYMCAYSWNLMWLDCLVLLPLMMLGLERLVKDGKTLLYTACLGLSVLSNYYIAIMMCIYSVLYFLYLMAAEVDLVGAGEVLKRTGRFIVYSIIGGCIGAVCALPALLALFGTASAGSGFPSTFSAYFNLLELFAHGMMNSKVTMISEGYVPNIFCSVLCFALIPLFCLNKKIKLGQRIGKSILMIFLWVSFSFNVLSYIWHGFHLPNSLPARQSFIYIFLILTICYEVFLKIHQYKYKQIMICFAGAIAAVFALQMLFSEKYSINNAFVNAGFLFVYLLVICLYKRGKENRKGKRKAYKKAFRILVFVILMVVSIAEVSINADETGYSTTDRPSYVEDNEKITALLESVPDTDFYRVEKQHRRTKNDGAWSEYRSASIFSSVTLEALSDMYESFGMQSGTNSFSYYGNTPLTSALLGVRYKLSDIALKDSLYSYFGGDEEMYLYKSKYSLPLGFMVKDTVQAEFNPKGDNPFTVQNDFIEAAKRLNPLFEIGRSLSGSKIELKVEEDSRQLVYVNKKMDNLKVDIYRDGELEDSKNFSSLECRMVLDLGDYKAKDRLEISSPDEDAGIITLIPAVLNYETLDKTMTTLGENPWVVTEFSGGKVTGEVEVTSEYTTMFTTIPYEKGWTVTVKKKKTEYKGF
ncbi:MAG: YfhO family protein, partial [Lachnospiraceae bacterium]|nr:YfhO family protein [Lachnospiraceae bacterium]